MEQKLLHYRMERTPIVFRKGSLEKKPEEGREDALSGRLD